MTLDAVLFHLDDACFARYLAAALSNILNLDTCLASA